MATDRDSQQELHEALEPLPDHRGGLAVVMATASSPPALALLSTGDVHITAGRVRVGIWASGSAASRLGGAFSLLVPAGDHALRVEAVDAVATRAGGLALIEGRIKSIRPTAEPPWVLEMTFRPSDPESPAISAHLEYWSGVRAWLRGEREVGPTPPG